MTTPTPSPARYAVIGHPVEHSLSPQIHQAFAEATGQTLSYERILAPLTGFAPCVHDFATGGALGCNVTVPFKFEALALATQRSARAQLAQAANLLRFDAAGWWADNTDGIGLVRDIEVNAERPLAGQRVLLVGAGGAAAGVLGPLLERAPASLQVLNRSPARAQALVERHAAVAAQWGVALTAAPPGTPDQAFDIVINASASSLRGELPPLSPRNLAASSLVIDLMYGAPAQPFLDWARAHGAQARDGLGLLVEQAAESFWLWRGVRPPSAQVLAELSRKAPR